MVAFPLTPSPCACSSRPRCCAPRRRPEIPLHVERPHRLVLAGDLHGGSLHHAATPSSWALRIGREDLERALEVAKAGATAHALRQVLLERVAQRRERTRDLLIRPVVDVALALLALDGPREEDTVPRGLCEQLEVPARLGLGSGLGGPTKRGRPVQRGSASSLRYLPEKAPRTRHRDVGDGACRGRPGSARAVGRRLKDSRAVLVGAPAEAPRREVFAHLEGHDPVRPRKTALGSAFAADVYVGYGALARRGAAQSCVLPHV